MRQIGIFKEYCKRGHKLALTRRAHGTQPARCYECRKYLQFKWNLKRIYNLSPERYDEMLALQQNKCFICGIEATIRRMHIDHNHLDGQVRALLCSNCNTALGLIKEDENTLYRMLQYVIIDKEYTKRFTNNAS